MMENELRFYYPDNEYECLKANLEKFDDLESKGCFHELTIQYDHPMKENSFYDKKTNGRFRVRISSEENGKENDAKISWKKRTERTSTGTVNEEEEVEVNFNYDEFDNVIFLLEDVIRMKKVESYERYRNIYKNEDVEIVVDKYPFGVALEIENKSCNKKPEEVILNWIEKLNLNINSAYRLSWDDKYTELCKEQNVKKENDVLFDKIMPKIKCN